MLHVWKSSQSEGMVRLKIPHKIHMLSWPNVLVYKSTNTDRFTTFHLPASLRAVFNMWAHNALINNSRVTVSWSKFQRSWEHTYFNYTPLYPKHNRNSIYTLQIL